MSEDQLSALFAKLKEDAGLMEKLKAAGDLDTAVALTQEAGFDVSKADWLRYQAKQTLELSDEDLEGVSGGATDTQSLDYIKEWLKRVEQINEHAKQAALETFSSPMTRDIWR